MISAEKAKALLEQRDKLLEQEQKFYWFRSLYKPEGLKEAQIEQMIRENIDIGYNNCVLESYIITPLGKEKLKEYGYTLVDLSARRFSGPIYRANQYKKFCDCPNYIILFGSSNLTALIDYYVRDFCIYRESIKVYYGDNNTIN